MMISKRTMAPSTAAKQASTAASKVKYKMLNTSSFFKVSLKTNNKALAVALAAEKQKSRVMEKELVYFQKRVKELCFELAARRHKHRKLLNILKELHCNTLQRLDMVKELFSDDENPTLLGDDQTNGATIWNQIRPMEILAEQVTSPSEIPKDSFSPPQHITAALNQSVWVPGRVRHAMPLCHDNKDGVKSIITSPTQTTSSTMPHSSSMFDEAERKLMLPSVNDLNLLPGFQSNCENSKSNVSEPEQSGKQSGTEKTILLNTSMEMTVTSAPEIVTVGRKTKKINTSDKQNQKTSNKTAKPQDKMLTDEPTDTLLKTDAGVQDDKIIEPLPAKPQCNSKMASRIPKMARTELKNQNLKKKEKLSIIDELEVDVTDTHLPDMDDYFKDVKQPSIDSSKSIKSKSEEVTDAVSTINCKRSKGKGRRASSAQRKTFFITPMPSSETMLDCEWAFLESEHHLGSHESETQDNISSPLDHNKGSTDLFLYSCFKEDKIQSLNTNQNTFIVLGDPADVGSKITCRRTRSKRASQDTRRTFDLRPLPCHETNSNGNCVDLALVSNETQVTEKDQQSTKQDYLSPSTQSIFSSPCLSVQKESEMLQQKMVAPTKNGRIHKTKCRQEEEHNVIHAPSSAEAVKPRSVKESWKKTPCIEASVSEMPSSCKRPWVATEVLESFQQDRNLKVPVDDEESVALANFQLSKRARWEETSKTEKERSKQKEERNKRKTHDSHKKDMKSDHKFGIMESKKSVFLDNDHHKINRFPEDLQTAESLSDAHEQKELHTDVLETKSKMSRKPNHPKTAKLHAPRNLRETFVVHSHFVADRPSSTTETSDEAAQQKLDLVTDEKPPWLDLDASTPDTEVGSVLCTPRRETTSKTGVTKESANEAPPAGRALASLTNTLSTAVNENTRKTRPRTKAVEYKEPSLMKKMRRGDQFTDSSLLCSPMFKKEKSKKKSKKQK